MRPWAWLARNFGAAEKREAVAPHVAAAAQAHIMDGLRALSAADVGSAPPGGDLPAAIYGALLAKRFRKYGVSAKQQAAIRAAIRLALEKQAPLQICVLFGGYKLWRLAEAPEPDWAELFALMHCARWLRPVSALYPPGVALTFVSDDVIVGRLNNLRQAEIDTYLEGFAALLRFVGRYAPSNIVFSLQRVGALYATPAAFEADLAARIQERLDFNRGALAPLPARAPKSIALNVRPRRGQTKDPEWRERNNAVRLSYYNTLARRAYLEVPERIQASPDQYLGATCIPIGTTGDSIVKFWIGAGALRRTPSGFRETVLSPAQLARAEFAWVPMRIRGLRGRNFRKLRMLGLG